MYAFNPLAFNGIVQTNRNYTKHIYWNICFGLGYVHFFSMQTLSLSYKLHVEYFFNVCYETIGDLFDILVLRVLPPNQPPFYDGHLIFMWKMPKTKTHMDIRQPSQYLRGNRAFFRHLCRDRLCRILSSVQIYSGPCCIIIINLKVPSCRKLT